MFVVFVHLHISIYLYLYSSSPTQSAGPPQNETKIHQHVICSYMYCVLHSYLYRCGIRASLYLYSCYFTFEAYLQTNKSAGVAHWSETTKRVNSWNKGDTAYSQWHYFHLWFLSISDKWCKTILPSKAQHIVGLFSAILEFVYKQIPETQKGASRVCEALGCGCSSLKFLNWLEGASWMCVCGWSTRPNSKLLSECKKRKYWPTKVASDWNQTKSGNPLQPSLIDVIASVQSIA